MGAALIGGPLLQTGRIDIVTTVIGSAAILAGAALVPSVVTLSSDKLEAKWWWGKRTVLPWSSAEAAFYDAEKHEMLVYGSDGNAVKHTQYHVDGPRFRSEVARHVKHIEGLRGEL